MQRLHSVMKLPRWIACPDFVVWDVFGYDGASADDCAVADAMATREDGGSCSDLNVVAYGERGDGGCCFTDGESFSVKMFVGENGYFLGNAESFADGDVAGVVNVDRFGLVVGIDWELNEKRSVAV